MNPLEPRHHPLMAGPRLASQQMSRRESPGTFKAALDACPFSVQVFDREGNRVFVNAAWREAWRVDAPDHEYNIFDDPAFDSKDGASALRTAFEGEPAKLPAMLYELPPGSTGGAARWVEASANPAFDESGNVAYVVLTQSFPENAAGREANSLAELAKLRAQLANAEKLSALGSMVAGVAHEVRTPLTIIASHLYLVRSRIETAQKEGRADPELADSTGAWLDEAQRAIDRINQLVLELRRFSKRGSVERVPARLDEVVRETVRLFEAASGGKHPVRARLERVGTLSLNVGQIQQVVLNLLENAADASPEGSHIDVGVTMSKDGPMLEVTDAGVGIPAGVQRLMYEAFYTTKKSGTGLGLSIVERIVSEHRAHISCESRPGMTRFRVTFETERAYLSKEAGS